MKLLPPNINNDQHGFAMVQVLVAMGILGILVMVFSSVVAQTVHAQRLTRTHGEKIGLQAIFRGSLTCQTSCQDLKRDIPAQIGKWSIKPVCVAKKIVLNVSHPELYGGKLSRLYKQGQEQSVCKNITLLGPARSSGTEQRRRTCNQGQKVAYVNFSNQTISCK